MRIAIGSSSLKIVALTIRAYFYVNPGKNITNRYNWFSVLTNLKDKVKIDLLEMINCLEYINNVFILSLLCSALKVPLQDWLITDIIEINKEQFCLKSYAWFQNRTEFQLPLYYIHFENAKFSRPNTGFFSESAQIFYCSSSELTRKKLQKLSFIFLKFDWLL